jgi:hypothetical protein
MAFQTLPRLFSAPGFQLKGETAKRRLRALDLKTGVKDWPAWIERRENLAAKSSIDSDEFLMRLAPMAAGLGINVERHGNVDRRQGGF